VRNRGIDLAIREFYELERMILAANIRSGIREGVFRPTDVERLAALISVHLDGVIVASSIRAKFDMDAAIGDIKGLLIRYLGAGEAAAQRGRPFAGKRKSKVVERKKETKRA